MGIPKGAANLLYELKVNHEFGGKILQLGKQDIIINPDKLVEISLKFGFKSNNIKLEDRVLLQRENINDVDFFKYLGFDFNQKVLSIAPQNQL